MMKSSKIDYVHILFVEIHVDYEFSVLKSRITNFLTQMMVDLFFGKQSQCFLSVDI